MCLFSRISPSPGHYLLAWFRFPAYWYISAVQRNGCVPAAAAGFTLDLCAAASKSAFIHLSTLEQVQLAGCTSGRGDLILLCIAPSELGSPVRWEFGIATDPESTLFPHLYGPLSVCDVIRVPPTSRGPMALSRRSRDFKTARSSSELLSPPTGQVRSARTLQRFQLPDVFGRKVVCTSPALR